MLSAYRPPNRWLPFFIVLRAPCASKMGSRADAMPDVSGRFSPPAEAGTCTTLSSDALDLNGSTWMSTVYATNKISSAELLPVKSGWRCAGCSIHFVAINASRSPVGTFDAQLEQSVRPGKVAQVFLLPAPHGAPSVSKDCICWKPLHVGLDCATGGKNISIGARGKSDDRTWQRPFPLVHLSVTSLFRFDVAPRSKPRRFQARNRGLSTCR